MPNINVMKKSQFLKKEDVGVGKLVTIKSVTEENVAMEGAEPEMKWCLHLNEFDKPLVMNSTNAQIIAQISGSQFTEDWGGKQIVLYDDPNVTFGGKITGGVRVRAPKNQVVNDLPF